MASEPRFVKPRSTFTDLSPDSFESLTVPSIDYTTHETDSKTGDERSIFLGDIPISTTVSDLQLIFKDFPISDVNVKVINGAKGAVAYAFITFPTVTTCEEAVAMCKAKNMVVEFPDGTQARVGFAQRNTRLHISNLDFATEDEDLIALFSKYGKLAEPDPVLLMKRPSSNPLNRFQTVCYAVIRFAERQDAETALKATNNTFFAGRRLRVDWNRPSMKNKYTITNTENHEGSDCTLNPSFSASYGSNKLPTHNVLSIYVQFEVTLPTNKEGDKDQTPPVTVNEQFMWEVFERFGNMIGAFIKNNATSISGTHSQGFGFVHFEVTQEGYDSALAAASIASGGPTYCHGVLLRAELSKNFVATAKHLRRNEHTEALIRFGGGKGTRARPSGSGQGLGQGLGPGQGVGLVSEDCPRHGMSEMEYHNYHYHNNQYHNGEAYTYNNHYPGRAKGPGLGPEGQGVMSGGSTPLYPHHPQYPQPHPHYMTGTNNSMVYHIYPSTHESSNGQRYTTPHSHMTQSHIAHANMAQSNMAQSSGYYIYPHAYGNNVNNAYQSYGNATTLSPVMTQGMPMQVYTQPTYASPSVQPPKVEITSLPTRNPTPAPTQKHPTSQHLQSSSASSYASSSSTTAEPSSTHYHPPSTTTDQPVSTFYPPSQTSPYPQQLYSYPHQPTSGVSSGYGTMAFPTHYPSGLSAAYAAAAYYHQHRHQQQPQQPPQPSQETHSPLTPFPPPSNKVEQEAPNEPSTK